MNFKKTKNVEFIVVSSDEDERIGNSISSEISALIDRLREDAICYTYIKGIEHFYSTYNSEDKKIKSFLDEKDDKVCFRNLYWIFLIVPKKALKDRKPRCEQQIWLRAGKIIGHLASRCQRYDEQISFWLINEPLNDGMYPECIEKPQYLHIENFNGEKFQRYLRGAIRANRFYDDTLKDEKNLALNDGDITNLEIKIIQKPLTYIINWNEIEKHGFQNQVAERRVILSQNESITVKLTEMNAKQNGNKDDVMKKICVYVQKTPDGFSKDAKKQLIQNILEIVALLGEL